MIFTKPTAYAIRALVYVTRHRHDGPILAAEIAREEKLPAPFLAKLLRRMTAHEVLTGTRGRGGGFRLAKDPAKITLYDIFLLYDGLNLATCCIQGCGQCSDEDACIVHELWRQPKKAIELFLRNTTIADLAEQT